MFEEMHLAGLADPDYHQTSASVQLALSARQVDRALDARLPSKWRAAMARIREGERVSTGDVASALDVSRPAAIKLLRSMEEAEVIEWVGKSAKDPRAYWQPHLE